MAIMFPKQLPASVLNKKSLKGEIQTYEAFAGLSDDFIIFYNRCVGQKSGARAHKRRIDFLVLHEHLGMLAVEVKGGKIRIGGDGGFEQYQHTKKMWASIDPFDQVEKAMIQLVKDCKHDGANYWIPDNVCVLFPGTERHELTNTPQTLPDSVICADDLPMIKTQMARLFAAKSVRRVWAREDFLDMRRRLQNMPEAQGRTPENKGQAGTGESHRGKIVFVPPRKTASEATEQIKQQKHASRSAASGLPRKPGGLRRGEDMPRVAYLPPKPPLYTVRQGAPLRHVEPKRRINAWEAVIAVTAMFAAFIAASLLIRGSVVRGLF